MRGELATKDERIATQERDLVSRDVRIATQERDIVSRDERIATQERDIVSRDVRIATQERDIVCRDERIATQERDICFRDERILQLQHDLEVYCTYQGILWFQSMGLVIATNNAHSPCSQIAFYESASALLAGAQREPSVSALNRAF
jgi:hypothetical protein